MDGCRLPPECVVVHTSGSEGYSLDLNRFDKEYANANIFVVVLNASYDFELA